MLAWRLSRPSALGLAAEAAYLTVSSKALGSTQSLELGVNKSMIVDFPVNVGEVIASQPDVATVVMRSKKRAIVQGISGGDTNIFFLDANGKQHHGPGPQGLPAAFRCRQCA